MHSGGVKIKLIARKKHILFLAATVALLSFYLFNHTTILLAATERPPYPLGCEPDAVNVTTASGIIDEISEGHNVCVIAAIDDEVVIDRIESPEPVYIGTNGGSMNHIRILDSVNIVLKQARFTSTVIRDSKNITIEKSKIGGTKSNRVFDQLVFIPNPCDPSNCTTFHNADITVRDNEIAWTNSDDSGNTGYGIRAFSGDRLKIERNYIHHIAGDGIQLGSGYEDIVIDRNEISYVAATPGSNEHSDDLQVGYNGPNTQITNNYMHHNGYWEDAEGNISATGGSGPYIHAGSDNSLLFENNLVRDEQNFMRIGNLGTGGTERSNLTFRNNTFYNNGLAFTNSADLLWSLSGGENNLYERNVVNNSFGNEFGFGEHTAHNNNLHGSEYSIDNNGHCTVGACNPPDEEPIGYRTPTNVWWGEGSSGNPTVSITSPSNEATVAGMVNIVANAEDDEDIAGVQFKVNGNNLGSEDTTFPFSAEWDTTLIDNGTYTLTAVARDNLGNTTTSEDVMVTVENDQAIARSIWNNSVVPNEEVLDTDPLEVGLKFRSAVAGEVLGVRFHKGVANTGTHVGSLWSVDGTRLAQVTFTNETASGWQEALFAEPVSIEADTTYIVSYHTQSGRFSRDIGYFSSNAFTNYPLRALADGEDGPNAVYHYGDGGVMPDTPAFMGSNYWVDIVFEVPDTTDPTVEITAPEDGVLVRGTIALEAEAGDDTDVVGVQFKRGCPDNCVNIGSEDTSEPYTVDWDTTEVPDGEYTLTATARDAADNAATADGITVTVDNTAPNTTITSHPDNLTNNQNATFEFTSNEPGTFECQIDGLGYSSCTSPKNYTDLSPGSHTFVVHAIDEAGNVDPSPANFTWNIDAEAPTIAITNPVNGSTISGKSVTISATADDNEGVTGVQFKVNGENIGSEITTPSYEITWNSTNVSNGNYTLTAVARDEVNNVTTSSGVIVTVENKKTPSSAGGGSSSSSSSSNSSGGSSNNSSQNISSDESQLIQGEAESSASQGENTNENRRESTGDTGVDKEDDKDNSNPEGEEEKSTDGASWVPAALTITGVVIAGGAAWVFAARKRSGQD